MYTYTYTRTHIHIYIYIYIHTHTYVHSYIYIYSIYIHLYACPVVAGALADAQLHRVGLAKAEGLVVLEAAARVHRLPRGRVGVLELILPLVRGGLVLGEKWEALLGIRLLGTTCWSGLSYHQAATAQMRLVESNNILECPPLFGALPQSPKSCPPALISRSFAVAEKTLEGTKGTLGKGTVQKIGVRYISLSFKPHCFRPFANRPFAKRPFGPLRRP